ncbi:MAG TPA: hypothetical protein VGM44_15800 [Polyangiaceae bacterium]|jgi:hypothetical protein
MITIRRYFAVLGLSALALLALPPELAHATGEACLVDTDCKTEPSCGGEICDWTKMQTCQPASAEPEGWCNLDSNCKCQAEGASCDKVMFQCTKTMVAGTGAAGTSSSSSTDSSSSGCSFSGVVPRGSLGFAFGAVCAAALIGARRRRRAA